MAETNQFSDNINHDDTDDFKKGVKYLVDSAPGMKKLPPEFVLNLTTNPLSASDADIPEIDLSGLNGPSESRVSTLKAIRDACANWGFFRVVHHGVEDVLMEKMINVVEEFHGLSLPEKMKYASDDVLSPIRYGTSLNTSKKHSLHWRDFLRHYGHPFEQSFQFWPENPPNYRTVAKEYLEEVRKLAVRIGEAISEGLGVEPGFIEEKVLGDGIQVLVANYYPRCPEPDKTLGFSAHSDHGGIILLMDNGVSGLQVKHDDKWITVDSVPNSFIVNLGDTMEILTNGKYKSVEHRAIVNGDKTRISIGVARVPNLSKCIGPQAPIMDKGEMFKYKPVVYQDYLRVQQSSTVRGKSALETIKI